MPVNVIYMAKTVLLLLTWSMMGSESYLLQQNYDDDGWNKFWHKIQTTTSPNLLSSCPWDYVKLSDNTIHAQIFPFARIHCIDLYKSSANGPAYDPYGACQPIKSRPFGCTTQDRSVNVGYTCVHSVEIITSKRNSVKNDTLVSVNPPTLMAATRDSSPYPSFISYTSGHHGNPGHGTGNMGPGIRPGETPTSNNYETFKNDTLQQNLYPPFLNGLMQRLNRTPIFLQGMTQTGHSEIFMGNQRPLLGMPPLERPLNLMDLIKGNTGTDTGEETQNSSIRNS